MLDYYDCPVCMEMKEELYECSSCTTRACVPCLAGFSKKEHDQNANLKAQNIYKCTLCYKVAQQKPMHKFLKGLLNEIKFKCPECLRVMTYESLKGHKGRGECQRGLASQDELEEDAVMENF